MVKISDDEDWKKHKKQIFKRYYMHKNPLKKRDDFYNYSRASVILIITFEDTLYNTQKNFRGPK